MITLDYLIAPCYQITCYQIILSADNIRLSDYTMLSADNIISDNKLSYFFLKLHKLGHMLSDNTMIATDYMVLSDNLMLSTDNYISRYHVNW
jgi:hypothetical protein